MPPQAGLKGILHRPSERHPRRTTCTATSGSGFSTHRFLIICIISLPSFPSIERLPQSSHSIVSRTSSSLIALPDSMIANSCFSDTCVAACSGVVLPPFNLLLPLEGSAPDDRQGLLQRGGCRCRQLACLPKVDQPLLLLPRRSGWFARMIRLVFQAVPTRSAMLRGIARAWWRRDGKRGSSISDPYLLHKIVRLPIEPFRPQCFEPCIHPWNGRACGASRLFGAQGRVGGLDEWEELPSLRTGPA